MTTEPTLAKVQLTDGLGLANETHAAPAVLDTDDIEVLREALAVAWGDSMTAQLKNHDQAAEIDRMRTALQAVVDAEAADTLGIELALLETVKAALNA